MGISIWQLLIILAIVLVVFGAKRLRNLGGDLGSAVKNFREAVRDRGGEDKDSADQLEHDQGEVIEGEAQPSSTTEKAKEHDKV